MPDPDFVWHELAGASFLPVIKACYGQVVHWRRNLFRVPVGNIGSSFVRELSRLYLAYTESSALESAAIYAAMVLPPLLLQKPPGKQRPKDLTKHLERRLALWHCGDIKSLLNEGCTIQSRLSSSTASHRSSPQSDSLTRRFTNFMLIGNVRAAIRLLSDNECGGALSLDAVINGMTVKDVLLDKHPTAQPVDPSAILPDNGLPSFDPISFESFTPDLIRSIVLKINGSAGPSGLDAAVYVHPLVCPLMSCAGQLLCLGKEFALHLWIHLAYICF